MTPQTLGVYETDNLAKQACLNHKATKLDVHNIPWRKIHYPKYFMYVMEDTYINYYVEVWEVKHGNGD
jgi:hypothetical protein